MNRLNTFCRPTPYRSEMSSKPQGVEALANLTGLTKYAIPCILHDGQESRYIQIDLNHVSRHGKLVHISSTTVHVLKNQDNDETESGIVAQYLLRKVFVMSNFISQMQFKINIAIQVHFPLPICFRLLPCAVTYSSTKQLKLHYLQSNVTLPKHVNQYIAYSSLNNNKNCSDCGKIRLQYPHSFPRRIIGQQNFRTLVA